MLNKIRTVLLHPSTALKYLGYISRRVRVSKVVIADKVYHRFEGELYPDYLNHGNACSFISPMALKWCKGRGLDIGASEWPLGDSIPIRNEPGRNAYELEMFDDSSLDYIFSSHCLEHLESWKSALQLWIRKIKPGGTLFLYLPHESMKLWNPWGAWVASGHMWKPNVEVLLPFLQENGVEVLEYNSGRDEYWSFHIVGTKSSDDPAA